MTKSDLVDLTVNLKYQTEKAWLVNDGERDAWIPKSRGELSKDEVGSFYTLTIPQALAEEKELV